MTPPKPVERDEIKSQSDDSKMSFEIVDSSFLESISNDSYDVDLDKGKNH